MDYDLFGLFVDQVILGAFVGPKGHPDGVEDQGLELDRRVVAILLCQPLDERLNLFVQILLDTCLHLVDAATQLFLQFLVQVDVSEDGLLLEFPWLHVW